MKRMLGDGLSDRAKAPGARARRPSVVSPGEAAAAGTVGSSAHTAPACRCPTRAQVRALGLEAPQHEAVFYFLATQAGALTLTVTGDGGVNAVQ